MTSKVHLLMERKKVMAYERIKMARSYTKARMYTIHGMVRGNGKIYMARGTKVHLFLGNVLVVAKFN